MKRLSIAVCLLLLLAACMGPRPEPPTPYQALNPVAWKTLPGWSRDSPGAALETFKSSCQALAQKVEWQQVCRLAEVVETEDPAARLFFESYFQPYRVQNRNGSRAGLITGYYGPELAGRRTPDEEYRYPLYRQPKDLLIVDLGEVYPELDDYRLRGRLVENRVVPYFARGKIDQPESPLAGQELFWVKDPVELFFLHIQGSGRIRLPDGERVMVNYANQNGHPYRSIGKLLLERKAMTRDQMSLQNIRNWVAQNPDAGRQLLAENPSYIFFRELPSSFQAPPGALGVPLTARRSLAVDPRVIPLGAPVYLATTFPGTDNPLRRLMMAQDTGGAIKGQVRADFFWGMGDEAGKIAGRMKQEGQLWVLLPKDFAQEMVVNIQRRNQARSAPEAVN